MTRLEGAILVVGFGLLVVALAAWDWRVGLGTLGLGLMAAAVDWRLPR